MWYDDSEHCDETMKIIFFKWYDGYKKRMVKKPQHKKSSCYYLASIKIMGLVYVSPRPRKKAQKNCGHKQGPFCIL